MALKQQSEGGISASQSENVLEQMYRDKVLGFVVEISKTFLGYQYVH